MRKRYLVLLLIPLAIALSGCGKKHFAPPPEPGVPAVEILSYDMVEEYWADKYEGAPEWRTYITGEIKNNTDWDLDVLMAARFFNYDDIVACEADHWVRDVLSGQTSGFFIDSYGERIKRVEVWVDAFRDVGT